MAIDSDSAFGGPANQRWSQDLRPGGGYQSWQVRAVSRPLQSMDSAASQTERLPFGLTIPSSARAQSIPLSQNNLPKRSVDLVAPIRALSVRVEDQARQILADHVTPLRLASHLSVLAVAAIILIISQIDLPAWDVTLRLLPDGAHAVSDMSMNRAGSRVSAFSTNPLSIQLTSHESLQRSAIPFTIVNEEPQEELQFYTVQAGDTVLGIAEKFGIRPETILWSNAGLEQHVELIRPGDQLAILPIDGAYHTIAAGESLSTIAEKYSVSMDEIIAYPTNGLEDSSSPLTIGQKLVIPGGSKPYVEQYAVAYTGPVPASAKIGSGAFVWPTSGPVNQTYWGGHPAVDIGGWTGAPVTAADSGYVTLASTGWNTGYGNYVVIDHGNGFTSLYAHLNSVYVRAGESVARGQQVGSVGNTGNSTGPHLHLEIRYQGSPRNPMGYLP